MHKKWFCSGQRNPVGTTFSFMFFFFFTTLISVPVIYLSVLTWKGTSLKSKVCYLCLSVLSAGTCLTLREWPRFTSLSPELIPLCAHFDFWQHRTELHSDSQLIAIVFCLSALCSLCGQADVPFPQHSYTCLTDKEPLLLNAKRHWVCIVTISKYNSL